MWWIILLFLLIFQINANEQLLINCNDDSKDGNNALINTQLDADNLYFINVRILGSATGTFQIKEDLNGS